MDRLELFESLGIALGIGLLIGVERGWTSRDEQEGERALGLRTFALIGLLGGVIGSLSNAIGEGNGLLVGLALVALAPIISFFRWRELEHEGTYGATTVVAALLTYALGAMAVLGDRVLAAGCGVTVAGLLALKPVLHGWLRRMTWEELRAGLVLLAMSVILLPLLPQQGPGPLAVLNPHEIWLLTVLIAGMSFAGYVAIKVAGDRFGVLLAGAAGGLTSSTAATLSLMRMARDDPGKSGLFAAGAAVAGVVMMARVLAVAFAVNPAVAQALALPLGLGALGQAGCAAVLVLRGAGHQRAGTSLNLVNPFDLASILRFGLLLAVIMTLSRLVTEYLGAGALYALAAVSGLADVDAVTLSMARVANGAIAPVQAANAILIAVGVNTAVKAALGAMAAGKAGGSRLALAAASGLLGIAAGYGVTSLLAA